MLHTASSKPRPESMLSTISSPFYIDGPVRFGVTGPYDATMAEMELASGNDRKESMVPMTLEEIKASLQLEGLAIASEAPLDNGLGAPPAQGVHRQ